MEETGTIRAPVFERLRRFPADLSAVLVAVVLVNGVVFTPVVRETFLRVPVGLAFVLFVPGYAVVSAVFPERGRTDGPDGWTIEDGASDGDRLRGTRSWWARIDGVDRIALSVALSVVVVPVIGTLLAVTRYGVQLEPILVAVSGVTVLATIVAVRRRMVVPPAERFRVPFREWVRTARSTVGNPDTRGEAVLNAALIVAVLLALASAGYAAAVLPQDDEFSAIYVLPDDGEAIDAEEYPFALEPGAEETVRVGVENDEGRTVDYTVVVITQELTSDGDETTVENQRELDRFDLTLGPGESEERAYELESTAVEADTRISWLLYLDDEPDEPSVDDAAYRVHLTVAGDDPDAE